MKAYKATYNGRCGTLTYEIGKTYTLEGELQLCKQGFHYCMKIENIFTGSKTEISIPGDTKLQSPIIDKRNAQVISLGDDSIQLMDLETYETFEAALPNEEELKKLITEGAEVEYWNAIGKRKIMRVKPAS